MTQTEDMSEVMVNQRLAFLAKRERTIRTSPSCDPDDILNEDQLLESIRQERLALARRLKEISRQRSLNREAKADARLASRDEALKKADELRSSLLERAAQFDRFVEDLVEMQRLDHVAQVTDKYLQQQQDGRALGIVGRHEHESYDRLRTALTNYFGAGLFGLPPFVANRNSDYRIESVIEQSQFVRY